MKPSEIGKSYDQLADLWNSDEFPRKNAIEQHERALAFVAHKGHALDIGCGSSGRIVELLKAHGFAVEGIDVSERMIELARRRDPAITFYHADICEWPLPRKYDFISAWDSIWHLPLAENERVLRKILDGLAPGGVFIFTSGGLDEPGEQVDSAMGPPVSYSTLGISRTLQLISDAGCICRHLEYDQYPESHLCVIAQAGSRRET